MIPRSFLALACDSNTQHRCSNSICLELWNKMQQQPEHGTFDAWVLLYRIILFAVFFFSVQSEIPGLTANILFLTTLFLSPRLVGNGAITFSYFLQCPCCCTPAPGISMIMGARRYTF